MRISDWSSDVCSSDLRDAEPILHARIDLAKAVLVGDHLTAQRHPDRRARSTADRLLQPRAPDPRQGSGRRDTETAADLEMIAAWKIQVAALLLLIQPKGEDRKSDGKGKRGSGRLE